MNRYLPKRIVALLLCLMMALTSVSAILTVSAANLIEHPVQNGTGTREPVRVEGAFSYRVSMKYEFAGFAFAMPTWNSKTSSAVLSCYKWQGNYEDTMATEPVVSKSFDPLVDNFKNWVYFDPQPAGEYLFHISNVSADVGVWVNTNPTNSKGFLYINGKEQRGEPEMYVRFKTPVSDPFENCQASQDLLFKKELFPSGGGAAVYDINDSLGIHLNVGAPVTGMEAKFGTYHNSNISLSMSAYAWKGSYTATIAEEPVATGRTTLADNMYAEVNFSKLPVGEYLFLIHDMSASPAIYTYDSVGPVNGDIYADGVLANDFKIYPYIRFHFAAEVKDYYLPTSADTNLPDGNHKTPDPYVIPSDSLIYTHEVMPDTWVFTDGLGRVSLTNKEVGDLKDDKTLAMFYWTWHISGNSNNNPNILQDLATKYPEAMRDYNHALWKELGDTALFWNEPIYGFYRGDDAWVQRRQAELLANAGVDVIFTDNTNGTSTWRKSYTSLMNTWVDAMQDGVLAPKVSFMLPFWDKKQTNTQVQLIYQDIFRSGKWQELWFYWDKKPMLMAYPDSFNPIASLVDKEIADFFTFRKGEPEYLKDTTNLSNWGWLSMYPQELYYKNAEDKAAGIVEQMTVGTAQNHNYVTHKLSAMNADNITGRSYTTDYEDRYVKEGAEASKWGYNFAQQWKYALEVDPKVVFVTGWNEWTVSRFQQWEGINNAFPDQFTDEFSRDIEPTKGALQDHYYYQLVNFVRQYKGARPIPTPTAKATIDLNAGAEQWNAVGPYYAAYIGNTDDRDAKGYGDLVYTETSGRNDIIGARVARDDEFVYFFVECNENITPYTDKLWMNLYIDSDQSKQGWNTFEFVVNKTAASEKTLVLEKFTADNDYSKTEKVADVEYKVDGKTMTVKIPKTALGLTGDDYTINFAWTDNVHDEGNYETFSGDIMDFYISGDVAPGGRFKYSYISTADNAKGEDISTETTAPDDSTPVDSAPAETAPETTIPAETDASAGGCKSSVAVASAVILTAAAAAVALKKKED